MRGKSVATIAAIVLVVGCLLLASQSLYVINEYEQAIVLQFGRAVRTVMEPGIHVKLPFIQDVLRFDKRVLSADGAEAEYLTSDSKRIVIDYIARWRIVDPLTFYQRVTNEIGAQDRLDAIIVSSLRQAVNSHPFSELIDSRREMVMEEVTAASRPGALEFGIEIIDVRIKRADLPAETVQSVFDRMEAERYAVATGYRAEGDERALQIRSEADKEREIILAQAYEEAQKIRGEGEARAIQIYAEAYQQDPEFFAFIRSLEAYQSILEEDATLILSADAPLFRYLQSPH